MPTENMKNALSGPPFETHQCDDLLAVVLTHDKIDLAAELPGSVHMHMDYTQDQIIQSYRLSRQLWKEGMAEQIIFLREYIGKIYRLKPISSEELATYKEIRAKMKHLRCAFILFDTRHHCPKYFNRMIVTMGRLQDLIKNDLDTGKKKYTRRLRLYLRKLPYYWISRGIDNFQPCTAEKFKAYMGQEMSIIREQLDRDKITNKEFHETRKLLSRQVAFYDCMKALYPSQYHTEISSYLSTVYTLMGDVHDEIVLENLHDTEDHYVNMIELPADIKARLADLASAWP